MLEKNGVSNRAVYVVRSKTAERAHRHRTKIKGAVLWRSKKHTAGSWEKTWRAKWTWQWKDGHAKNALFRMEKQTKIDVQISLWYNTQFSKPSDGKEGRQTGSLNFNRGPNDPIILLRIRQSCPGKVFSACGRLVKIKICCFSKRKIITCFSDRMVRISCCTDLKVP